MKRDADCDGLTGGSKVAVYRMCPAPVDTDNDGVADDVDVDPLVDLSVIVYVKKVSQIDPVDIGSDGDFFAKIWIGWRDSEGQPHMYVEGWSSVFASNTRTVSTNWCLGYDVPDDRKEVWVCISLYDDDGGSPGGCKDDGDDTMDISGDGSSVDVYYSLKTGTWTGEDHTGDSNGPGHSSGEEDGSTDTDEDDCEIWFDIQQNDYDGDGLTWWEEVNVYGTDPAVRNYVGYFVMDSLYPDISSILQSYCNIVEEEIGIGTKIIHKTWESPTALKKDLAGEHDKGMVGATFVGPMPIVYYFYDNNPAVSGFKAEVHVTDLFYEDLDGIWIDTDNDGVYDAHSGDVDPEIWVGQLRPPTNVKSEIISVLQKYFEKASKYLKSGLNGESKALLYIDDDWEPDICDAYSPMCDAFTEVKLINTAADTTAEDYKNRLTDERYKFVQIMVHGDSRTHFFGSRGIGQGTVTADEIHDINIQSFFFNLFSCKNAAYDVEGYIAGEYVFGKTDYGLCAISSSKVGGMLGYRYFYNNINNGEMIGWAYLNWWKEYGMVSNTPEKEAWFGGMVFIGDPALLT